MNRMPQIILRDKKGFTKSFGFYPDLPPTIRVPIFEEPKPADFSKDAQFDPGKPAMSKFILFYRGEKLAYDVWEYREEL